jgi:probable rRNA maturation factor
MNRFFTATQNVVITSMLKQFPLSKKKLTFMAKRLLSFTPYPDFDLAIIFVGNKEIHKRNLEDRGVDKPTDVLSYPINNISTPGKITDPLELQMKNLGDIVISLPYITNYCKENNLELGEYLPFIVIHGICHLQGYDHENEKDDIQMRKEECRMQRLWEESLNGPFDPYKMGIRKKIKKKFDFMHLLDLPTTLQNKSKNA